MQYDTNKDGAIGGVELVKVPALKSNLTQIDTSKDGKISADEIDARIAKWKESLTGEMTVSCVVTLDGAPLNDAKVVFEPESFLGTSLKPASGTSGPSGTVGMSMAKEHLADPKFAGVACGWYKIRITHASKPIHKCYNSETILGCEVAADAAWNYEGSLVIALKSTGD